MPYPCHTVMSVGDGIVNWSILMPSKIIQCTHVSILKQLFEDNVTLFLSFELVPELSRPDRLTLL